MDNDDRRLSGDIDGGVVQPERGGPPGVPRWVKVCAVIAGVVAVLLVVVKLTGAGGEHGPGRHMGAGSGQSGVVTGHAGFSGAEGEGISWR